MDGIQETQRSHEDEESGGRERFRAAAEFVIQIVLMALIVFSARSSLADWYEVPSGSMLPTIQLGDRIVVNKLAYDLRIPFTSISLARLGEPKRGDIVVFVYPRDGKTDYVKRLVGLPGDTVEVRNDVLYINGKRMPRERVDQALLPPGAEREPGNTLYVERIDDVEHFVFQNAYGEGHSRFGPFQLGKDEYFMMGDNRDNSSDSRKWGVVPRKLLRGRALLVALSFKGKGPIWPIPGKPRWPRLFSSLYAMPVR